MAQREKKTITLKMIYESNTKVYECQENILLEQCVINFAKDIKEDFSSLYALYGGGPLFGEDFKKPLSQIIKPPDKIEKLITLLFYKNTIFNIADEKEIQIVLSIESVKVVNLSGKKGDIIKDIIRNSSSIIFDLKWCVFKYKENEIDLNKKFDDIANDEDKVALKITLELTYTIPLKVTVINEKNEKYEIQCLLKDRIGNIIFSNIFKNKLDNDDYDLIYENEKLEYYYIKIFYEIYYENKSKNSKEKLTHIIKTDSSTNILENTNVNMLRDKQKNDKVLAVLTNNDKNKTNIAINLKLIKKSCYVRYKRKIKDFLDYLKKYKWWIFGCSTFILCLEGFIIFYKNDQIIILERYSN